MVTRRSLSDCSNTSSDANEDGHDTVSVATSSSEDNVSHHNELVLQDEAGKDKPNFSNIAVTNSTDVHFGNKTYYQGPVTIKQFLYANPQLVNGEVSGGSDDGEKLAIKEDSLVLDGVPDSVIIGKDNPAFTPETNTIGIKLKHSADKQINANTHHPEVSKGTRWLRNFSRQRVISVLVAVVLLISLVTSISVVLTRHQLSHSNHTSPQDTDELQSGSPSEYPTGPLRIITRQEWLATPRKGDPTPLQHPVPYVIIMHTATEICLNQSSCMANVKAIQFFHMDSRKWDDVGYSFMVGGDGNAYEGRGWNSVGAQVYGYNSRCIGVAFIGTFNKIMPTDRQLNAAKRLIETGVAKGYIAKDYKLLAARQLQTTQSPGLLLYEHIKTWPHWAEEP